MPPGLHEASDRSQWTVLNPRSVFRLEHQLDFMGLGSASAFELPLAQGLDGGGAAEVECRQSAGAVRREGHDDDLMVEAHRRE